MTNTPLWRRLAGSLLLWGAAAAMSLGLQYGASFVSRALAETAFAGTLIVIVIFTGIVGKAFDRTMVVWAALFGALLGYYYFVPQWALVDHLLNDVFDDSPRQQQSVGALVGGLRWLVAALCLLSGGLGALLTKPRRANQTQKG